MKTFAILKNGDDIRRFPDVPTAAKRLINMPYEHRIHFKLIDDMGTVLWDKHEQFIILDTLSKL